MKAGVLDNPDFPGGSTLVASAAPSPRVPVPQVMMRSIWLLIAAQIVYLFGLMSQGWFLQSELSNLSDASRQSLTWHYLSESLGGHFAPIGRLEYWFIAHIAPLNYSLTIGLRVAYQAVATYLLYRLLVELVGPRWINVVVTGLYCVSPLLIPGSVWLTSGIVLLPAQILSLLCLLSFVRFVRRNSTAYALRASIYLVASVLTSTASAVLPLLLPIIAFGLLHGGGVRERVVQMLRQWRGWAILATPMIAYFIYMMATGFGGSSTSTLSLSDGWRLVRQEWLRAVGPALIGGPWQWYHDENAFLGFSAPPEAIVVAGQVAVILMILLGWREVGAAVVAAWALPLVAASAGILLVGFGRLDEYGALIPITPRYSFTVAVPLAMAVVLSFARARGAPDARQDRPSHSDRRDDTERQRPAFISVSVCAVVLSSLVSSLSFVHRQSESPAKSYVHNLSTDARLLGPSVNIYDTAVPQTIISSVEPNHYVSTILDLAGVHANFNDPTTVPLVADDQGRLRPSGFLLAAGGVEGPQPNCGHYLSGVGSWRIPLQSQPPAGEWFLQLALYQNHSSTLSIKVEITAGTPVEPVGGPVVFIPTTLAVVSRRLPWSNPTALLVSSSDPEASVCLSSIKIGLPVAQKVR